ncbi:MAG: FAD-dependent oxidoreductase [Hyphomonas sp.]|nr:FAD-dependent oxidoreductase [Hyphomonas sp.]MCB9971697.1 FAD-dependent oxidoreductase [Hyphomonas sp.]
MVGKLTSARKKVLLAGGGHAHIVALGKLQARCAESLDITLISPQPRTWYSGALPGAIAGHWPSDAVATNVASLCQTKGVGFRQGTIVHLDADGKSVTLDSGEIEHFDLLSLDVGSVTRPLAVLSGMPNAVNVRPIPEFVERLDQAFGKAVEHGSLDIVLIGAGLAGLEIALALSYRMSNTPGLHERSITIVEGAETILPIGPRALRGALMRALRRAGIAVLTGTQVTGHRDDQISLSTGQSLRPHLVINCTGAAAHAWIAESGLHTTNGFVDVDACLRSVSHPDIWASGDTSHFTRKPVPPAGVFAVRAGSILAANLCSYADGDELTEYDPQTDYLKLVSLGAKRAIAEKFGVAVSLPGLWYLKRRIDFSFLHSHAFPARD